MNPQLNILRIIEELQAKTWRLKGFKCSNENGIHQYSYESSKNKPSLLLIHGLADSAVTWHNLIHRFPSSIYRKYNIFIPNLPGSMRSAHLAHGSDYRVSKLAKQLGEYYLKKSPLGIKIIGNSFGGWMGLELAELYPDWVRALVLLSPAGLKWNYDDLASLYIKPSLKGIKELQDRAYYKVPPVPDFLLKSVINYWKEMNLGSYIGEQTDADFYTHEDYGKIKVPTHILWGDSDRILPKELSEAAHLGIQGSQFNVIKDCGHLPQKEAEDFLYKKISYLF